MENFLEEEKLSYIQTNVKFYIKFQPLGLKTKEYF
jgi:hypothetical protein